jgi:hypothetical protein
MTDVVLLVSGSRGIADVAWVEARIEQSLRGWTVPFDQIALVVNGNAIGVDTIARKWAAAKGLPVKLFKPDWAKHGKAAGMIRNREMLQEATHVIAVWDGSSKGTKAVIDGALARGKPLCSYTRVTPSI